MGRTSPRALVLTGEGINCEIESRDALQYVGYDPRIVHVRDLLASPTVLKGVQLLLLPGGFSYGDHCGAGLAMAHSLRGIESALRAFVARDTLVLGICNGAQVLLHLGLFADSGWHFDQNEGGNYQCRWVYVTAVEDSPFLGKGETFPVPVAHGEGRLLGGRKGEIALCYSDGAGHPADSFPENPNGADHAAAAVHAYEGRILAMMPHPERGFFEYHRPDWRERRERARRRGLRFNPDAPAPAARIFLRSYRALSGLE